MNELRLRHVTPADSPAIIPVVDDWWGRDGARVGFVVALVWQTFCGEAYIHSVGVQPAYRT